MTILKESVFLFQTSQPGYAKVGAQFEQAMVPVWHNVFSAEKYEDLWESKSHTGDLEICLTFRFHQTVLLEPTNKTINMQAVRLRQLPRVLLRHNRRGRLNNCKGSWKGSCSDVSSERDEIDNAWRRLDHFECCRMDS